MEDRPGKLPEAFESGIIRKENGMAGTVCYVKLCQNIEVMEDTVYLKDVGSIYCADRTVSDKVKKLKLCQFSEGQGSRCVISILKITEMIEEICPQVTVESVGETDVVAERVKTARLKKGKEYLKIVLVCAISFFGTAFTIMAYHNDIGIADVFARIHRIVMGTEAEGVSVLEISYSIGLALGIILFFNHVGPRRITRDPTPIEVEMRKYEKDVNTTIVDTADREGQTIDVR
ncbi:MAG: stage V sporulation protein AA [Lachnospiraceae bacterium]